MGKNILKVIALITGIIIMINVYNCISFNVKETIMLNSFYDNNSSFRAKEELLLTIPKIHLKTIIRKATDNFDNLDEGLVYYKEFKSSSKNIIFGHSGMGTGTYFNRIDELTNNDKLFISSINNSYEYVFNDNYTIKDDDTWILKNTENSNILLLVTCDKRSKNKRLVVEFVLKKVKSLIK